MSFQCYTPRTSLRPNINGGMFTLADGTRRFIPDHWLTHAELVKGRRMGVFSSVESARKLLENNELTSVIDRSEARRARLARAARRALRALPGHAPGRVRRVDHARRLERGLVQGSGRKCPVGYWLRGAGSGSMKRLSM